MWSGYARLYCSLLSMYITAFPCMCVCTLFGRERDVDREREKGIDTMIDSHVHVFIPNVHLCYTFIFVVVHVHVCQQVSINTLHV